MNAKNNFSLDKDEVPELFSTQMFILAEKLLELISVDRLVQIRNDKNKEGQYSKK
jgi:hypothetical protein